MGKVWIFQGGWDGHEPVQTSARFKGMLEKHGYEVTVFDTLEPLGNPSDLMELELMVFCWTMGEIRPEYTRNVSKAVGCGRGPDRLPRRHVRRVQAGYRVAVYDRRAVGGASRATTACAIP